MLYHIPVIAFKQHMPLKSGLQRVLLPEEAISETSVNHTKREDT